MSVDMFYRNGVVVNPDGSPIEKPKPKFAAWVDEIPTAAGDWAPGVAFAPGQIVRINGFQAVCTIAHTAFNLEHDHPCWDVISEPAFQVRAGQIGVLPPDMRVITNDNGAVINIGNDTHVLPLRAIEAGANLRDWAHEVEHWQPGMNARGCIYHVAEIQETPEFVRMDRHDDAVTIEAARVVHRISRTCTWGYAGEVFPGVHMRNRGVEAMRIQMELAATRTLARNREMMAADLLGRPYEPEHFRDLLAARGIAVVDAIPPQNVVIR